MAYSHQAARPVTVYGARHVHVGALAMPRHLGTGAGSLIVLLGIWGGIAAFAGPTLGYRWDTAPSWSFTWDRLWLNLLPGLAVLLGGLILIGAGDRLSAMVGAWLSVGGGIWFLIGPSVSLLWGSPVATSGIGSGSADQRLIEQVGFFYGLGAVVVALAAGAWARLLVRSEHDALLLATAAEASTESEVLAEPRPPAEPPAAPYAPAIAVPEPAAGETVDPTVNRVRRSPADSGAAQPANTDPMTSNAMAEPVAPRPPRDDR